MTPQAPKECREKSYAAGRPDRPGDGFQDLPCGFFAHDRADRPRREGRQAVDGVCQRPEGGRAIEAL